MTGSGIDWQTLPAEWHLGASGELRDPRGHGLALAPIPWDDFAFSVRITPGECEESQSGIVFRSDASGTSRYGFRSRDRGIFLLERFVDGGRGEIAARLRVPVDDSFTLTVIATDGRLRCFVDGRKVYDVSDPTPLRGRHVGVLTQATPAEFTEFDLEPVAAADLGPRLQALAEQGVARKAREYGFGWRVIDLKGRGGFLSVGDLDGDGAPDFVATHGTKYLTGVTQRGEVLWAFENPGGAMRVHPECQMPTTIYDIDGDGANEVVCRRYRGGEELLQILDGRTGAVKRELPWAHPMWPDAGEAEVGHIIIANLRGLEQPRDLLVTTAHHGIFAFTGELEPHWAIDRDEFLRRELPWLGHHPYPEDLDGDGHDEVCTGGMLLDHDGTVLWTKDLPAEVGDSHVDSVMIGDVDGDPTNGKEIAFSTGGCLLNARGEYSWKQRGLIHHGQMVRLGKSHADLPGLQMLVLDMSSRSPGTYLFSAKGEVLLKLPPGMIEFVDWDGDGLDEIQCGAVIYDAAGRILAELPVDEIHTAAGYSSSGMSGHAVVADVAGDAREEVVWTSGDLIIIFENALPNPHPPLRLTPGQLQARWKRVYHTTRY